MLSFVCFLRMTHKKLKLNFISAAIQLLIAIWCFLIKTCYYTQRIVFFRSCCTSRNFYFQPNYPIARRRRNHCMVELGGVGVPTYRNRVVIFSRGPQQNLKTDHMSTGWSVLEKLRFSDRGWWFPPPYPTLIRIKC